jgi:hypothetical protein
MEAIESTPIVVKPLTGKKAGQVYKTTPKALKELKRKYKELIIGEQDNKELRKQYRQELKLTKQRLKQSKTLRTQFNSLLVGPTDSKNFKMKVVNMVEYKNSKETLVEMFRRDGETFTLDDAKRLSKSVIQELDKQTEASEDKEYKLIIRVANDNRVFTAKGLNTDLELDVVDDYYQNRVKTVSKFVDKLHRIEFLVIERNKPKTEVVEPTEEAGPNS